MTDTELAQLAKIDVLPMVRDAATWALLDRAMDKFDQKTGALLAEGAPKGTRSNVQRILANDPWWSAAFWWDALYERARWDSPHGAALPVQDHHEAEIGLLLARQYGIEVSTNVVHECVIWAAHRNERHPVREWLAGLTWDGEQRLSSWASTYLASPDDEVTAAMARAWMIQAVARAYQPGCKADTVLILRGRQGARKSTSLAVLGGQWYRDTPIDLGHKDRFEALRGAWIYELAELDSLRKAEAQTLKAFVSSTQDSYRPSYGRNTEDRPRSTVFAGTTNDSEFLQDATGSRRWWVIEVGDCDVEALSRDLVQLWAEAVAAYQAGEPWYLPDDLERQRAQAAEVYEVADPLLNRLEMWTAQRREFSLIEAWEGCGNNTPPTKRDATRLGELIGRIGTHQKRKQTIAGRRGYVYVLTGNV